jgi:ATP-binding cassette subfamily B protein
MRPTDTDIKKEKTSILDSYKKAKRIFSFITPWRTTFAAGIVLLLVSSLVTMTFPYLLGKLIDTASDKHIKDLPLIAKFGTNQLALLCVGILIVQATVSYFRVSTFATVTERAMARVRTTLFDKLVTLSIPFFEEKRVGELTSRSTNDVDQLQDMLSDTLPDFVRQLVTIVFGIMFIFLISPRLTLLMLATVPVLMIIAVIYGKFIRKLSKERQDALAASNVVVEETMHNIHTVKAFTNEAYEAKRYRLNLDKVISTGIRGAVNRGAFATFLIFGLFGAFVLVLWYGTVLMKEGSLSAGTLTSFMFYTGFIGGSVAMFATLFGNLQKTIGASERIFEILNEPGEILMPEHEAPYLKLTGNIEFKEVGFHYPTRPDIQVLKNIDLSVNKGEKVALAGHSGAGKSTIAQLVLRFYNPSSGSIIIDGQPVDSYDLRALRQNMAIVPQEVILFGGSIRENIAYGKPGASDEEVIAAAKQANAWQFIQGFPEGLDTVVGERGIKLSGGQRQRIAIARAILKDPAILILDEATSSLDNESERLVQEALETLMKNRTTFIIAHRLSTIRNVDTIFVLKDGVIHESGKYDKLAALEGGVFQSLLKLQYQPVIG